MNSSLEIPLRVPLDHRSQLLHLFKAHGLEDRLKARFQEVDRQIAAQQKSSGRGGEVVLNARGVASPTTDCKRTRAVLSPSKLREFIAADCHDRRNKSTRSCEISPMRSKADVAAAAVAANLMMEPLTDEATDGRSPFRRCSLPGRSAGMASPSAYRRLAFGSGAAANNDDVCGTQNLTDDGDPSETSSVALRAGTLAPAAVVRLEERLSAQERHWKRDIHVRSAEYDRNRKRELDAAIEEGDRLLEVGRIDRTAGSVLQHSPTNPTEASRRKRCAEDSENDRSRQLPCRLERCAVSLHCPVPMRIQSPRNRDPLSSPSPSVVSQERTSHVLTLGLSVADVTTLRAVNLEVPRMSPYSSRITPRLDRETAYRVLSPSVPLASTDRRRSTLAAKDKFHVVETFPVEANAYF